MRNNYPEDALVVIRRIIRITEINSLSRFVKKPEGA